MVDSSDRPEDAWLAVVHAYQTCTTQYERMLDELGMTIPQFDVLSAIRSLGDNALPKNIAERLLVTRGNISGVLKRLEQRAWISLQAHPEDGRARICRLTADGAAIEKTARGAARRFIEAQLSPFSSEDLATTHRLMSRMTEHLNTLNPAALAGHS